MYAVAVTTYITRNCYLAYSRSGSGVRGICHGRICGFSLSKGGLVCIRIGAHASHHPIVHAHLWRVWGLQALQQGVQYCTRYRAPLQSHPGQLRHPEGGKGIRREDGLGGRRCSPRTLTP